MPTLKEVRRAMLDMHSELGRVVSLTGAAAQTATSAGMGGGVSDQKWTDYYLLRAESTAAADRIRWGKTFAGGAGTWTHTGTAYSDTTSTSEILEVHKYDPQLLDTAINQALPNILRVDRTEIVCSSRKEFWLGDLDWLTEPGDIVRLTYRNSPVLSRDRFLDQWNTVNSSGILLPDHWALSGASATAVRDTSSHFWRGSHVVKLTRAGADASLTQTVPVYRNGVDGYDLREKAMSFVTRLWHATASRMTAVMTDGTTTDTETHTGGDTWEELTPTLTVATSAEKLTLSLNVVTGDGDGWIGEAYLVETAKLNDTVRRDDFPEVEIPPHLYRFSQSGTLQILTDQYTSGQIIIHSHRPYPAFDASRIRNGHANASNNADADSTDCPTELLATAAIAELYRGMGSPAFGYWNSRREGLQARHLYEENPRGMGINIFPSPLGMHSQRRGY